MKIRRSLIVFLSVIFLSTASQAQLITYNFTGTITEIDTNENGVVPGLVVGDSFSGFTTFESSGFNNTAGTVSIEINGLTLLFDGQSIFGGVEVVPGSLYSLRIAADTGGTLLPATTFSAFNFGPDLEDTDGSAGHAVAFPTSLNLAEFEENVFLIGGTFLETGDSIFLTGELNSFSLAPDCLLGDINMDGVVDFFDIQPFIDLLSNQAFQCEGDVDENGVVDFFDIQPFISILPGQ